MSPVPQLNFPIHMSCMGFLFFCIKKGTLLSKMHNFNVAQKSPIKNECRKLKDLLLVLFGL